MNRSPEQLRNDALTIWRAGLEAVRSDRLVRNNVRVNSDVLEIAGERIDLRAVGRIAVVGAGKAGAGMAAGLEQALGQKLARDKKLSGWINVPADCVRQLAHIHLHAARPAGVNEPTAEGEQGAQEIIRLVESLTTGDLCIALISGGGSALLPLPLDAITLDDKLAVTRFLSDAGAPIDELNTVRKQLSRIKGGGLARACRAGQLATLVISDVLGDPLDVIASGPTIEDPSSPADAAAILERYGAKQAGIRQRVFDALVKRTKQPPQPGSCRVSHHVIGNNATAVDAAAREATRLGYTPSSVSADKSEGAAEEIGRHLAQAALAMRTGPGPDCLISGGEPTVKLVAESQRGLGGRNQQLLLAAVEQFQGQDPAGILILSAGTDGEDGPTDAAGAVADSQVIAAASQRGLDPADYLARDDAYHWFEPAGGLIKTGPTHTNVCDVRVALVDRVEKNSASRAPLSPTTSGRLAGP